MPKLRNKTSEMTRLLRGYSINGANLSAVLSCAPKTARDKIENPDKLTLGDLRAIHRSFGVPVDELRARIV